MIQNANGFQSCLCLSVSPGYLPLLEHLVIGCQVQSIGRAGNAIDLPAVRPRVLEYGSTSNVFSYVFGQTVITSCPVSHLWQLAPQPVERLLDLRLKVLRLRLNLLQQVLLLSRESNSRFDISQNLLESSGRRATKE